MKHLLIAIWISSAFIAGCSVKPKHNPAPVASAVVVVDEGVTADEVVDKRVYVDEGVLKDENAIPNGIYVCNSPNGCRYLDGKCIGCTLKKRDIATLDFSAGTLRTGEYIASTLIHHTGKIYRWEIPLKMSLRNISEKTYLLTLSGIGKIGDQVTDCSKPYVAMFVLDDNNIETLFKTLDSGSCPEAVSSNHKVKWKSSEHGLKKMKSYSNGTCIVGPCDWISTMINVYIYERI